MQVTTFIWHEIAIYACYYKLENTSIIMKLTSLELLEFITNFAIMTSFTYGMWYFLGHRKDFLRDRQKATKKLKQQTKLLPLIENQTPLTEEQLELTRQAREALHQRFTAGMSYTEKPLAEDEFRIAEIRHQELCQCLLSLEKAIRQKKK